MAEEDVKIQEFPDEDVEEDVQEVEEDVQEAEDVQEEFEEVFEEPPKEKKEVEERPPSYPLPPGVGEGIILQIQETKM